MIEQQTTWRTGTPQDSSLHRFSARDARYCSPEKLFGYFPMSGRHLPGSGRTMELAIRTWYAVVNLLLWTAGQLKCTGAISGLDSRCCCRQG